MTNEKIRNNMLLAGVTISELAEKLGISEKETCEILNTEMGVMQSYRISAAVAEIVKERT